jgi:diguanylate cyclase (GGDEF)-like protein
VIAVDVMAGWEDDTLVRPAFGAPVIRHHRTSQPFAGAGLGRRIAPFAVAAAFAEGSLALSYGSVRMQAATASVVLLAVTAVLITLPYDRLPTVATVGAPLVYTGSLLALNLAVRGSNAGFGPVLLIPLVWTALYHRRLDTYLVVLAIVPFEIVTSLWPTRYSDPAIVRRTVSWLLIGAMVAVAVHYLRTRFSRSITEERHLRRQTDSLVSLAKELTSLHDPDEVVRAATRAVASLADATSDVPVRAHFLEVHHDRVRVRFQYDRSGYRIETTWPLSEQPWLAEVLATGRPQSGPLDSARAGPTVRGIISEVGLTHGVWVPVIVRGATRGVLALASRGEAPGPEVVALATAIGNLAELALGNALTHQSLLTEAATDPLTGLANRRGFRHIVATRPAGEGFAVIVTDVDNLKAVNDQLGHDAGDELLIGVASALRSGLRHGDVVARMGGDEFAAMLAGVTEDQAISAAIRMVRSVRQVVVGGLAASISLGVAWSESDPEEALRAADGAMYRSKRAGGGRWTLASDPETAAEPSAAR